MFQLLFERSADAIFLFHPGQQVFIDCNQAAVEMMRAASKQQLLLVHPAELSPEFQPDGRTSREKTPEVAAIALAKGSHRFEWRARRIDGTEFPLEVLATPIQTGDQPLIATVCRDITERKAAEAALRESETRFRLLFERSADAMALFDPQIGRFIKSNEAIARQTGAPSVEALGQASPAEISPERQADGRPSSEKAEEMIRLALANGSHRFEWLSRRHDGSELPIEVVLTAIPFGDRPLLFAVSRDISDRKKAEREILELNSSLEQRVTQRTAELRKVNEQLKDAEQQSRQRAVQAQKHRDVLLELAQLDKSDFHRALRTICALGATTLDVARVSYWSLVEEDSAIVCEVLHLLELKGADEKSRGARLGWGDCPAYFAALAAERPIVANDVLAHPATSGLGDSYLKPLGITSMLDAPVWVQGEVVGVLCHEHIGPPRQWSAAEVDFVSALAAMVSIALEESKRARSERWMRESEEKFRALFEASSQGVMLHDEKKIIEVNPAGLRILGMHSASDMVGKHPGEVSAPVQPGGESGDVLARKYIQECIDHGSARFDWVARNYRGEEVPIEVILTRIQWGGRQLIQAVFNDIAERKQAEAELLRTLAREKELGLLRNKFVSMVSHEFRTPLGIIQSSAEILDEYLDRLEPGERREHLQSIQKNTRRMAALMEEVLLIGGLDAGKMEFSPTTFDVPAFVRRLVDEVLSATDRRCPIELRLHNVPAEGQGDERLLRHIFTNLLTNAVKYSEAGCAVQFDLECRGTEIVSTICDRGIGIPEADQEWLFSPFHRGRNVGDRAGSGLGLVIVKRCVDLHGGNIKIESRSGHGTMVTVRLPKLKSSTAAAAA